jgi:hypothetical protein
VGAEAFEGLPHCSGLGPGAIVPPPSDFTADVGAPVTSGATEFTDSERLPANDFVATANWGDGTETAASVADENGVEGCYHVTTSTHAYTVSGAYPFSYTVHDTHTGMNHTVGASTLYIWTLPQVLPSVPERTIVATVGVPWTGTLVELTDPPNPAPAVLPYGARIGWEPEREGEREFAKYQATVTTQPGGMLAVSGSHTFSAPVLGMVKVEVLAGELSGTVRVPLEVKPPEVKPAANGRGSAYRLVGRPVLGTFPRAGSGGSAEIVFRLSRELPRGRSGRPAARFRADGFAASVRSFGAGRGHACYAAVADSSLARSGERAFALTIPQPGATTLAWHADPRRYRSFAQMSRAVGTHLGC